MSVQPLFARVLLHRERARKIGNIHVPQSYAARHDTLRCKVVAKGPDATDQVEVGDEVLIGKFAGEYLDESGSPVPQEADNAYFVVQDEDIIAVIRPDTESEAA